MKRNHKHAEMISSDLGTLWKWVDGFEGIYAVSRDGEVFSKPRPGSQGGILRQKTDRTGYFSVSLFDRNKGKASSKTVHRLVALAFVDGFKEGLTVNHKNGIKKDNRVDNLEWATYQENCQHAVATGLAKVRRGTLVRTALIDEHQAVLIAEAGKQGLTRGQIVETLNVPIGSVRAVLEGRAWTYVTGIKPNPKGSPLGRPSQTGHVGVRILPDGRYEACCYVNRKSKYVGRYISLEDAIAARDATTSAAAEAHARALISLTEVQP